MRSFISTAAALAVLVSASPASARLFPRNPVTDAIPMRQRPGQPPGGYVHIEKDHDDSIARATFGIDYLFAVGGAESTPLVGNGTLSVTFEKRTLAYARAQSIYLGWPLTRLTSDDVNYTDTQACMFCLDAGWKLLELDARSIITLGGAYRAKWLATDFTFTASELGPTLGYQHTDADNDVQLQLGVFTVMAQGNPAGIELDADVYAAHRLIAGFGIYGRLGLAYGDLADFDYSYGGPILQLGLAYMNR